MPAPRPQSTDRRSRPRGSGSGVVRAMPFRGGDAAMLAGLRRREAPAVAAFFERYDEDALTLLGRILGPTDPELLSAHHDAFAHALERADEASPRRMDAWLLRLVVDEARAVLRRRRWPWRRVRREPLTGEELLARLPPAERVAAALFFVDGRSDLTTLTRDDGPRSAKRVARAERRLRAAAPGLDLAHWGGEVRDAQDEALADVDTGDTITRLLDQDIAPPSKPRSRARRAAVALAAVAVLGAGLVWRWPDPLTFTVDGTAAEIGVTAGPGSVLFSDGTLAKVEEGEVAVAAVDAHGATLVLHRGTVFLAVVPQEAAHWELKAGPYVVRVVGTKLEVSWDGAKLDVRVFEGAVAVVGPDVEHELGAEQHLSLP